AQTALRGFVAIGGEDMTAQEDRFRRGADWVVGTPGRLAEHLERGYANVSTVEALVLDEADQLLELGFIDELRRIASALPPRRQTLLFSATLPREAEQLARALLHQ